MEEERFIMLYGVQEIDFTRIAPGIVVTTTDGRILTAGMKLSAVWDPEVTG